MFGPGPEHAHKDRGGGRGAKTRLRPMFFAGEFAETYQGNAETSKTDTDPNLNPNPCGSHTMVVFLPRNLLV